MGTPNVRPFPDPKLSSNSNSNSNYSHNVIVTHCSLTPPRSSTESLVELARAGREKEVSAWIEANPMSTVEKILLGVTAAINAPQEGETALFAASKGGHEPIVAALLAAGAHMERRCSVKDVTALWIAASNGHEAVVKRLLANKANKEAAHETGATPVWIAASHGHAGVVRVLLAVGANKEALGEDGASPIWIASSKGHVDVVDRLLTAGANKEASVHDESTPVLISAQNGHDDTLKLLLKSKANPHASNEHGASPLFCAARAGHVDCVRTLLAAGVTLETEVPDKFPTEYYTPLHAAVEEGHESVVRVLLDAGADKEVRKNRLFTPLTLACEAGHVAIAKTLVDAGAIVNKQSLKSAVTFHQDQVLRHLVQKGQVAPSPEFLAEVPSSVRPALYSGITRLASAGKVGELKMQLRAHPHLVAAYDENGAGLFHLASLAGSVSMLSFLKTNGCKPPGLDDRGRNMIHYAAHGGSVEVLNWWMNEVPSMKTDLINEECVELGTPLHFSAALGHHDMTKALLELGADRKRVDDAGHVPCDVAATSEISRMLEVKNRTRTSPSQRNSGSLDRLKSRFGWDLIPHPPSAPRPRKSSRSSSRGRRRREHDAPAVPAVPTPAPPSAPETPTPAVGVDETTTTPPPASPPPASASTEDDASAPPVTTPPSSSDSPAADA